MKARAGSLMISGFDAASSNRVEMSSGCWYDAKTSWAVAGYGFLFIGERVCLSRGMTVAVKIGASVPALRIVTDRVTFFC
jgi:hypothetical protein